MAEDFAVRLSAGSLRHGEPTFVVPHGWTDAGVAVEGGGTGAHVLHAAVALCVLNDVLREARAAGLSVDGVKVMAQGGFSEDWSSTGISYDVELDSAEDDVALADLLARVDEIAEIPRALAAGVEVVRSG